MEIIIEIRSSKMRSGKPQLEEEEEEYEELGVAKKDVAPSNNNIKHGKNSDKANAIRSKHSVTEQRRRSKINERFQILRELIPHSDQKRDTASFLLEVIQYVQYLQEKVQKYEGSYQAWGSEPTKLMPWRNSNWRMHSFVGHPSAVKNGIGPGPTFSGRLDENTITTPSMMQPNQQTPIESESSRDATCKAMDPQTELANKSMTIPMPLQGSMSTPVQNDVAFSHAVPGPLSDAQSAECPVIADAFNYQEEPMIEGGTISISSVYSQGLLTSLTEALQSAGVDLSQATISVQINLGKRANRGLISGTSIGKDDENLVPSENKSVGHFKDVRNGDDLEQAQKRLKIGE